MRNEMNGTVKKIGMMFGKMIAGAVVVEAVDLVVFRKGRKELQVLEVGQQVAQEALHLDKGRPDRQSPDKHRPAGELRL